MFKIISVFTAFACMGGMSFAVNSEYISEKMVKEVCESIIPFGQSGGATISEADFYHCHAVLKLEDGESRTSSNYDTWDYLEKRLHSSICHAHEKDGKRVNDNFNIFHFDGATSFWGADHPVVEKHILERFGLPKENHIVSWTNIYFFPSESKFCPLLRASVSRTCGGVSVCIGLESDAYDQEQAYPTAPPAKP